MFSWWVSCWSHSYFMLVQLISCVYWNSELTPGLDCCPRTYFWETCVLPFPIQLAHSFKTRSSADSSMNLQDVSACSLLCCLPSEPWHAEACTQPPPLSLRNIKLRAIFSQFLRAFCLMLIWEWEELMNEEFARALNAGNKWRLTTPSN